MKRGKFLKSVSVALRGIRYIISKERNIKIQIFLGFMVIFVSILLKIPKIEFIIILFLSFFVIVLEIINTSVEKLIDKIHPNYDKDYGKIKDAFAGAVLLAVMLSIIIGALILFNPIISFFK